MGFSAICFSHKYLLNQEYSWKKSEEALQSPLNLLKSQTGLWKTVNKYQPQINIANNVLIACHTKK